MGKILIAGGGIGGLATALACTRLGAEGIVFERAAEFSEFGAGIQLGPNVTRVLYAWGLKAALDEVLAFPEKLQIRSAASGSELGVLRLGPDFAKRYGAPYATVHRADLHGALLRAVRRQPAFELRLGSSVLECAQDETGVSVQTGDADQVKGALLVAADGGWSAIRQQLLHDGTPQPTGHLAYRATVLQRDLPESMRSEQITVWLGPRLHVVQYPVCAGAALNLVAIVHGQVLGDLSHWDHSANAVDVQRAMAGTCTPLNQLIHAIAQWRLWPLSIRAPMQGAYQHARGKVALLGDAAHPMLPYLAQGAGMAIEDANVLAHVLAGGGVFGAPAAGGPSLPDVSALLRSYGQQRWERNARVQARAIRNGRIFHATGPVRVGRDVAMRLLGERLLDMPWLYGATTSGLSSGEV